MRINSRIVVLIPFLFLAVQACKKEKSSDETVANSEQFYFKATIDGSKIEFIAKDKLPEGNAVNSVSEDLYYYSSEGYWETYNSSAFLYHITPEYPVYFIGFRGKIYGDGVIPSQSVRVSQIKTGDQPFYDAFPDTLNQDDQGVEVAYVSGDEITDSWTSAYGDNETKGSFIITEIKDSPDTTGIKMFKASFSCTLYNINGDMIKVENGSVVGRLFKNKPYASGF